MKAAATKGERTRQRLLDAAERVFGEKGYHAASIVDITREAGVAMGTFYVYFPSKKDILVELVRTTGHEMRATLSRATRGLRTRAEVERAGLEAFLNWVRRHPHMYRVVRNAEFADRAVYEEWYRRLGEEYARALRKAMRKGEVVEANAEALAYCLMGVGDYAGLRWVLWQPDGQVPPDAIETVVRFIWRGLGIDVPAEDPREGLRGRAGGRRPRGERAGGRARAGRSR